MEPPKLECPLNSHFSILLSADINAGIGCPWLAHAAEVTIYATALLSPGKMESGHCHDAFWAYRDSLVAFIGPAMLREAWSYRARKRSCLPFAKRAPAAMRASREVRRVRQSFIGLSNAPQRELARLARIACQCSSSNHALVPAQSQGRKLRPFISRVEAVCAAPTSTAQHSTRYQFQGMR
jgi:hypothetical protein